MSNLIDVTQSNGKQLESQVAKNPVKTTASFTKNRQMLNYFLLSPGLMYIVLLSAVTVDVSERQ